MVQKKMAKKFIILNKSEGITNSGNKTNPRNKTPLKNSGMNY